MFDVCMCVRVCVRACVTDMVVGAICTDGGAGAHIMEVLRSAVTFRQVKWTDTVALATHTIVILTEGAVAAGSESAGNPKPYTLHPTPYTLHLTPYILHP